MLEYFPVLLPELQQVYTHPEIASVNCVCFVPCVWFHSLILCPGSHSTLCRVPFPCRVFVSDLLTVTCLAFLSRNWCLSAPFCRVQSNCWTMKVMSNAKSYVQQRGCSNSLVIFFAVHTYTWFALKLLQTERTHTHTLLDSSLH